MRRAPRYRLFGLTVQSDFELPAGPATDRHSSPDVIVRRGDVPTRLVDVVDSSTSFQIAAHELLLSIAGVARYHVRSGREIVVRPHASSSAEQVRSYLLGSAFGALLQQRGDLTLHASAVRVRDSAVAFAGPSGGGKSTLAAALLQRGYFVLTDDLCPVHFGQDGSAVVHGSFCRIKLNRDTALALGFEPGSWLTASTDGKIEVSSLDDTEQPRLPLRRLYLLADRSSGAHATIEPVTGPEGLRLLKRYTFRFRFMEGFGRTEDHFQQCVSLLRTMRVYRVARPTALRHVPALIRRLEEEWSELAAEDLPVRKSVNVRDGA